MKTRFIFSRCTVIALILTLPLVCNASGKGTIKAEPRASTNAKPQAQEEARIRAVLDAQVKAWNQGNLEEFMSGYWRSPKLTFFGSKRQNGWDETIEHYRQAYKSEGREMGKLVFSDLEIQLFSKDSAFVRGQWELTMSDGKKPHGLFTLIFRRFSGGWKIVHDHSSVSE